MEILTPALENSSDGSVIFMLSTAVVETFFVPQAFNALKAALITYGSQLAQALGPKGIRANMVSPGPISYPGGNWATIKEGKPELYAATEAKMALGRFGIPDDGTKAEMGEEMKAIVQPRDWNEAGDALVEEIIAYCRSKLGPIKCPKSIDFEKKLPRQENGKLFKRLVRKRYWPETQITF